MSVEQVRLAIMQHVTSAAQIDRAARLLERVKLETHWLLISTPARTFRIDDHDYAAERAKLVAAWPAFRRGTLPIDVPFYDLIGEGGSLLTHLIETRRQRARDRQTQ